MSDQIAKADFEGRLKKFTLPKQHALLPLFEAIVNSVQAIADAATPTPEIRITIRRDTTQTKLFDSNDEPGANYLFPIKDFLVEDNGIGFDDTNFESFVTLDSRQKETLGGRGIGRLSWLKAFDAAHVESVFTANEKPIARSFKFVNSPKPFQNVERVDLEKGDRRTVVSLLGFKEEFRTAAPKSVLAIAEKIIEHGISYLLNKNAPRIVIHDPDEAADLFVINDHLSKIAKVRNGSLPFKIGAHEFEMEILELCTRARNHALHICANRRTVIRESLEKYFPELPEVAGRIPDLSENGSVVIRVHSAFLDSHVADERHNFLLFTGGGDLIGVSISEILQGAVGRFKATMDDVVADIENKRRERVAKFIKTSSPKYMPLIRYAPEKLGSLSASLTDSELDIELHKAFHEEEIKLKVEGRKFFGDEIPTVTDTEVFRKQFDEFVKKVSDFNSARLAEYVVHRRTVIDILAQALRPDATGRLPLEDHLHGLFYPMKATSSDVHWRHQNLWLLDERLSFHDLLASDVPLKRIQEEAAKSGKEPDIVVFNQPSAYAETTAPFQSIVIIEFKRPERSAFRIEGAADQDEPFAQVYTYIDDIKARKIRDINGSLVELQSNARFFCYVITDFTDKMNRLLKRKGEMRQTADGCGYYGFNPEYNAYFEVLSYTKIINDARMRNRVLFDRLGLPL